MDGKELTMEAAAQEWLESVRPRIKASSCGQYTAKLKKNILPRLGQIRMGELTCETLQAFRGELLAEGLTPQYTYDILIQVKMITKYISRVYGCPDPAVYLILEKPVQTGRDREEPYNEIYSRQMYESLLTEPTLTKAGILLTLCAGLRIGELCALQWRDIDLERGMLSVTKTIQRVSVGKSTGLALTELKSKAGMRKVPLTGSLRELLEGFRAGDDCYFLSGTTSPIEPRTMQYRLRSFLKSECLPEISFSELRKLFIHRCVDSGVDIVTITNILGNASVPTALSSCARPTMDSKIRAMELVSVKTGKAV